MRIFLCAYIIIFLGFSVLSQVDTTQSIKRGSLKIRKTKALNNEIGGKGLIGGFRPVNNFNQQIQPYFDSTLLLTQTKELPWAPHQFELTNELVAYNITQSTEKARLYGENGSDICFVYFNGAEVLMLKETKGKYLAKQSRRKKKIKQKRFLRKIKRKQKRGKLAVKAYKTSYDAKKTQNYYTIERVWNDSYLKSLSGARFGKVKRDVDLSVFRVDSIQNIRVRGVNYTDTIIDSAITHDVKILFANDTFNLFMEPNTKDSIYGIDGIKILPRYQSSTYSMKAFKSSFKDKLSCKAYKTSSTIDGKRWQIKFDPYYEVEDKLVFVSNTGDEIISDYTVESDSLVLAQVPQGFPLKASVRKKRKSGRYQNQYQFKIGRKKVKFKETDF